MAYQRHLNHSPTGSLYNKLCFYINLPITFCSQQRLYSKKWIFPCSEPHLSIYKGERVIRVPYLPGSVCKNKKNRSSFPADLRPRHGRHRTEKPQVDNESVAVLRWGSPVRPISHHSAGSSGHVWPQRDTIQAAETS